MFWDRFLLVAALLISPAALGQTPSGFMDGAPLCANVPNVNCPGQTTSLNSAFQGKTDYPVPLATSTTQGAIPAWPNNTTTFFRGDGSYQILNCASLLSVAPSCSIDATNAANISSGTLGALRLPAFGSADVSCAAGGGACTIAAGAVTGGKIAGATIAGSNIAASTIAGSNIAGATIAGSNIAASTIAGSNIAGATIAGSNIAGATIANSNLATATQNTVKGAAASTAEADLAVPSCSSASSALTWTTNTGFGCNTISGALTSLTNSLGADVALNNTANYFDGPSTAQGTSGTWFASGTVTLVDTVQAGSFVAKLWDGTTVIASAWINSAGANAPTQISLSGVITSPAANIRISVKDSAATSGKIVFNQTGNSKDSTLTVLRIQ